MLYIALGIEFFTRFHNNKPFRRAAESKVESKAIGSSQTVVGEAVVEGTKPEDGSFTTLPLKGRLGFVGRKLQLLLIGMGFSVLCLFIR